MRSWRFGFSVVSMGVSLAAFAGPLQVEKKDVVHFVRAVEGLHHRLLEASRSLKTEEQVHDFRGLATVLESYLKATEGDSEVERSLFGTYLLEANPWLSRNFWIADHGLGEPSRFDTFFGILAKHSDTEIARSEALQTPLQATANAVFGSAGFEASVEKPEPPAQLDQSDLTSAVNIAAFGVAYLTREFSPDRRAVWGNGPLVATLTFLRSFLAQAGAHRELEAQAKSFRHAAIALTLVDDPEFPKALDALSASMTTEWEGEGLSRRPKNPRVLDEEAYRRSATTLKAKADAAALRHTGGTAAKKHEARAFQPKEAEMLFKLAGAFVGALPSFVDQVPWKRPSHVGSPKDSAAYRLLGAAGYGVYAFMNELLATRHTNYLWDMFAAMETDGLRFLAAITDDVNGDALGVFRIAYAIGDPGTLARVSRQLHHYMPRTSFRKVAENAWMDRVATTDLARTESAGLLLTATSFSIVAHRLRAGISVREADFAARQVGLLIDALDLLHSRKDAMVFLLERAASSDFVGKEEVARASVLLANHAEVRMGLKRLKESFELHARADFSNPEFGMAEGVGVLTALVDTGTFDPDAGCRGNLAWTE